MAKLTVNVGKPHSEKLTERTESPFIITFRRKLHDGYRFTDLSAQDLKKLQTFFDIVSECTVNMMDKHYRRKTDKEDIIDGLQVIHYGTENGLRIHGVYIEQRFEVIRIDVNHKKHR
jgi:hypothetical protein